MKRALLLAAMVLAPQILWVQAGNAAEGAKVDAAKGQEIVNKVCVACHGVDGNSPSPVNPNLAGQIAEYTEKQLLNFKPGASGKADRANPVMAGFAATLSADDIRNVSAYFAGQKPKQGAARNKDTILLGQKLWRGGDLAKGIPACASCHGASGAGIPVQYPRLAGQHAQYTEAQLRSFRAGERANDAAKMMRTIAGKMNDAEIKAVADYAAGLK